MSKVLIDTKDAEKIYAALNLGLSLVSDKQEKASVFDALITIQKAIIESKQKETSVIEWHGTNETPPLRTAVLVRYPDGKMWIAFTMQIDGRVSFEGCGDDVDAWAYFPN